MRIGLAGVRVICGSVVGSFSRDCGIRMTSVVGLITIGFAAHLRFGLIRPRARNAS